MRRSVLPLLAVFALACLSSALAAAVAAAKASDPLFLGMSRERLVAVLGQPAGAAQGGRSEILRYPGGATVVVAGGAVVAISGAPYHAAYEVYLAANGGRDPYVPAAPAVAEPTAIPPSVPLGGAPAAEAGVPAPAAPAAEPPADEAVPGATPAAAVSEDWTSAIAQLHDQYEAERARIVADAEAFAGPPPWIAVAKGAVINFAIGLALLAAMFRILALPTDWLGLVVVAAIDVLVKSGGALLATAVLEMDTLFGAEKFLALPIMLVTLMKFTSARSVPTAVRVLLGVQIVGFMAAIFLVNAILFSIG